MAASAFTFSAPADTDVWKKPPSHDVFTAPYKSLSKNAFPQFKSASITFTSTYTHQFDQAGIVLVFTKPSLPRKWIKAGVELFNGQPRLSTVCCDNWADWSVANANSAEEIQAGRKAVTILVERLDAHDDNGGQGWELEIGALVARPTKDTTDDLEAKFQDFQVKWDSA
ncbi:hypothetical protein TrVGV298_008331 [Trichoderma virens]|nr:hypothetical protein TrVGV298_008331 [Trichoderma virens]